MGGSKFKKKLFTGVVIFIVLCIGIGTIYYIHKYTNLPSEEELINYNSLENILQKKDSLYIEQKIVMKDKEEKIGQICYLEYAEGIINKFNSFYHNPIEDIFYNGYHYRNYQDTIYAVCEKNALNLSSMIDIFSSCVQYLNSAGAERVKPQKLERNGQGYILSYNWKTSYDTNVFQHELSFRFSKDMACKEIKQVENDSTIIYSFEYGNKKDYFNKVRDIHQNTYIKINVTNISENERSFGPCKIPTGMYVWIEHMTQAELYLDADGIVPYTAATHVGPNAWITAEPIDQDLSLFLKETYE